MATQPIRSFAWSAVLVLALASAAFAGQARAAVAAGKESAAQKQRQLIGVLLLTPTGLLGRAGIEKV